MSLVASALAGEQRRQHHVRFGREVELPPREQLLPGLGKLDGALLPCVEVRAAGTEQQLRSPRIVCPRQLQRPAVEALGRGVRRETGRTIAGLPRRLPRPRPQLLCVRTRRLRHLEGCEVVIRDHLGAICDALPRDRLDPLCR